MSHPLSTEAALRIPLAPSQRGIYFLYSLARGSSAYIVPVALRVRGPLEPLRLARAVDTLLTRHQALRTTFEEVGGDLVQVVHPPADAPRVTVHWAAEAGDPTAGDPAAGDLAVASREAERRAWAPFDLAEGPLWRVDVVPIGPEDHALTLAFHHIVFDEASASVLAREVSVAYDDPAALPGIEPGREYVDFCLSRRDDPEDGAAGGLDYWRERLGGLGPQVLPQERTSPSPEAELFAGERRRFTVPPATSDLLGTFCARHRVSVFMVFHSVLATLLHGWTGRTEITIGTPVTSRADDRFAETVGYFQNTLVLRSTVDPLDTFAELLERGRRTVLEALAHQHTPFESVVAAVRPARDTTRNPLFQAALVYNRARLEQDWGLPGLRVDPLPFDWPVAQFDLTLTLVNDAGVLNCEITYDTGRFVRETMDGLAETFVELLRALLLDPELTVARAPRPQPLVPVTAPAAMVPTPRVPDAREEILCGLFREVLGIVDVGADDNFFDLGGHSLLAGRLISRVRAVLDATLSLRDLFEAPTVTGLIGRMRGASDGAGVGAGAGAGRPGRVVRPQRVPLSHAQRGLWFLDRLEGPSPTYNVPLVLRFPGGADSAALRAALLDVLDRHESLRTIFPEVDGEACQVVVDPARAGWDLPVVEVSDVTALDRHLRAAATHPFDLATEIPVRAWLFAPTREQPSGEHVVLLLLHHIACDIGSLGPLGRDLGHAYAARCAGSPPTWNELPVQYADYTLWQRDRLGAADDPTSLAARRTVFWRGELAGLPQELALPADRPRPAVASYRGAIVRLDWDAGLHRALTGLARETSSTLFMVVQAGFAALLCRLGAGTDLPIGTPTGDRGDDALHDLVGYFANTLVLRTDVSGDPTFRELVERVRQRDLAAFAAGDLPFDQVVDAVNPVRSLSRHPLFQVMLSVYRDLTADPLPGVGFTTALGEVPTGVSKFDLSVNLRELHDAGGIQGHVAYSTDLFDAPTVKAMVTMLEALLRLVAADPDQHVGTVDLLDRAERHRLLVDRNDTARDVPADTVHELVQRQAARVPDATAVVCGTDSLSYAELNARANRLARRLIDAGVGPERFVVVALPHSVELVVALLAVLKAGGAYVPLDPDQPAARIASIVDDVDPVLVLRDTAAAGHPAHDVTAAERIAPVTAANAAYAIFTSGSTGRPKGVVIEHRSLHQYLAHAVHAYPGLAGTALVPTSAAVDLTVTGLLAPLTTGGCVWLGGLDEDTAQRLPGPPTFLKVTPSHLPLLASLPAVLSPQSPSAQLVVAGEALHSEALHGWRREHPLTTVVNSYGPTETTVGCTHHRLEPGEQGEQGEPVPAGPVPIGRPLWNTRVYVLDDGGQPVPPGVPGELYVGGAPVGRGYLNRPALTARRFLPDPYGPPGSRLYRTGDLVRWNAREQLEYLSRTDDQVKVRGVRIEPFEVEAALAAHERVAEAAVAARDDGSLVAYLVPSAAGEPADDELRSHLADRLPPQLVPDVFVRLTALPRTAGGKVDRRALPAPDLTAGSRGRAARTPTEQALRRLFAEVLDRPAVGVDDSFFALGGHSLLAVRLVGRIRQELGRRVPVGSLIGRPTVAALAAGLDSEAYRQGSAVRLRPGRSGGSGVTVALVHPVGGTLFCYQELVDALPAGIPVVGCERLAGGHPAERTLWDLAERHAAALLEAVPDGPVVVAGWSVGGVLAHAVAARLLAMGSPVAGIGLLDSLAIRTDGDRDTVRRSGARLASLAERARLDRPGVLSDPLTERLLAEYGLEASALRRAPAQEVAEMLADWAALLELLAEHEPVPLPVPASLFVCAGNPGDLPERIVASWSGLCAGPQVHPIAGDHLTVLRSPAVGSVAAGLVAAHRLEAAGRE